MKILVLAGTSEARLLSERLVAKGHEVIASLAGRTRAPLPIGCTTRMGGFGGAGPFRDWLSQEGIVLVIDATHPFANRITARSAQVCAEIGLHFLLLNRPPWNVEPARGQIEIETGEAARMHISPGANVFLATGRQTLEEFANLSDCRVYCRQIDPPDGPFPFEGGEFVIGRPPFTKEEEVDLFQRLSIDVLVVKNAGGAASSSKLEAAEALGIKTLFIKRPALPDCPTVTSVDAALAWVEHHAPD